jgi:hypothetical protein
MLQMALPVHINFKVQRQQNVIHRTMIQNDNPWKLKQVQYASNHLQQAILTKLCDFSLQANYTDQATAACRRS